MAQVTIRQVEVLQETVSDLVRLHDQMDAHAQDLNHCVSQLVTDAQREVDSSAALLEEACEREAQASHDLGQANEQLEQAKSALADARFG